MKIYVRPTTVSATFSTLFFVTALITSTHTLAQPSASAKKISSSTSKINSAKINSTKTHGAKTHGAKITLAAADEDSMTPDITASIVNEYKCELNDSLTIYTNKDDDNRAAIRWKNKLYGLKRVATTTGANRFENKRAGLVWIGIPTKGMLLDSIRGQQLTNDCITGNA